ncbi:efflux RND transporter periplasmic adaptor subunit [Haloferula sp. BvORR071]|uniref:efflux RND transporter periplasmic adaptor subunit n=1 Tax=Haloferula sp. BvORR071 TaxID=1396141 RepID=UPI00054D9D89|nr:efflux RND transporter periplasmic adaptor subunit [Haloferula sp. BvORR071]
MKYFPFVCAVLFASSLLATANEDANTVVLDETGVKNLRIETVVAEESDFEESVFALGRIESLPNKAAAVSSRIPGRIVDLTVSPGDKISAGQTVAKVESRQPGDPPPTIELKAPISGLVMSSDARLGDPVEPDKALLEIIDLGEVQAIAQVPEHQAAKLKPGTKAHIKVSALPEGNFEGELLRFGNSADRESGTIDAIFKLANTTGAMRPGMRAEFSIVVSKRENVISVPRAALQGDAINRFVYVKHFDLPNAFIKTPVQIGQMNDRMVEITSGLLPADDVVTRGAYSLSFAGGGSVSLKEALDAAHGHEHNADGSELTAEQKKAKDAAKGDGGHDHEHGEEEHGSGNATLWKIISGVLALMLVVSAFVNRKGNPNREEAV